MTSPMAEAGAGIPRALALSRAARLRHLRYTLFFGVPRALDARVHGRAELTFSLSGSETPLVVDFAASPDAVGTCIVNGTPATPAIRNDHLVFEPELLREGENTIEVTFVSGDGPLNRRDGYLYTLLVPARARELFPCFDQPDLKATFSLTLEVPEGWEAVSNAREHGRRVQVGSDTSRSTQIAFDATDPLPTYLFAFAAGAFAVETAFRSGRMMRLFHLESDDALVTRNRRAIVDQHVSALEWLEDYTRVPYPFPTFDIVLLPAFQFGGMEHPGAIYYNAASLLLEASATRQQLLARAHLIAHETAHMWFGDLVTMRWFGDVWMKEVFANFMAAKIVNPAFPDLDHDLRFLHGHYPAAYDVDRTAGTHPIRQELENLADAGSLYGPIIYLKSPVVMRQLELRIGAEALRDGVREYLRRHAFSSADWSDLLSILQSRTADDLLAWSHDWLDVAGRPGIGVALACDNGTIRTLRLPRLNEGAVWAQHLEVALGYGSRVEHVPVDWHGGDVEAAAGRVCPDYVLPNGRGLGYGEFRLDEASLTWLLRNLPEIDDALTRGSAWLTLWDGLLARDVRPAALVDLMLRAIPRETSDLNLQRVLTSLERLFWTFLTPVERAGVAPGAEAALRGLIEREGPPTGKAMAFATFRAIATTGEAVGWLQMLLGGTAAIDGLPLADGDRVLLVQELAVRGVPEADRLIEMTAEHLASVEKRSALRFVSAALSADESERSRFFDRLREPQNRRREPWVVDGLRWLHHPLRQESSRRLLEPGLNLLEEVKRTGDIFLPKRWLDAMLWGHATPEAAALVRQFLRTRRDDYPAALRRLVLASADYLFRATAA